MASDLRALARRRVALNATAAATLAGAYDPVPQRSITVSPLRPETVRLRSDEARGYHVSSTIGRDCGTAGREATGIPRISATPGQSDYLTELRAFCDARAADLAGAFDDPDVLADRQAIAAEELLPPAATPERDASDRHQGHHRRANGGLPDTPAGGAC